MLHRGFKYVHNFSTESLFFWKFWKGRLFPSFYPYLLTPDVICELKKIAYGVIKRYYLTQKEKQELAAELVLVLIQQMKRLCETCQYIESSIFSLLFSYLQKSSKKYVFQQKLPDLSLIENMAIQQELLLEDKVIEQITFENLYKAIGTLPALEREIIESVYFKNVSLSQKAKDMDHSVSYVCKKKQKALRYLKDMMRNVC